VERKKCYRKNKKDVGSFDQKNIILDKDMPGEPLHPPRKL
jgi:hypothetical protein